MPVAVVTGASRGLGAGLAEVFADRGVRLGLCARREPVLADGADVVARQVDVTDADAVEGFLDEVVSLFGSIDLWVNNAGVVAPVAPLADLRPADVAQIITVNVLGAAHGMQAFVRHRRSVGGGGVLVNMSSAGAEYVTAGMASYCASKAAIDRMTEAVSKEEAGTGLRAYSVWPGLVDTDMLTELRSRTAEQLPEVEMYRYLHGNGLMNSPAWVATQILDLAFGDLRPEGTRLAVPDDPARPSS